MCQDLYWRVGSRGGALGSVIGVVFFSSVAVAILDNC